MPRLTIKELQRQLHESEMRVDELQRRIDQEQTHRLQAARAISNSRGAIEALDQVVAYCDCYLKIMCTPEELESQESPEVRFASAVRNICKDRWVSWRVRFDEQGSPQTERQGHRIEETTP